MDVLVVVFKLSKTEAWDTTLREFWRLHKMKVEVETPQKFKGKIKTNEQMEDFKQHLRDIGALED